MPELLVIQGCHCNEWSSATNVITGLADAMIDSLPLVVFTGQVATTLIGSDAFQEADIMGLTMPVTKHNYQVRKASDLPRIIKEAFHIARTGRPGPVVIDLPKDMVVEQGERCSDVQMDLPDTTLIMNRIYCK